MQYIDRSPAILTSDDFIRSNEIIRINGQIIKSLAFCSYNLMISSEYKNSR